MAGGREPLSAQPKEWRVDQRDAARATVTVDLETLMIRAFWHECIGTSTSLKWKSIVTVFSMSQSSTRTST